MTDEHTPRCAIHGVSTCPDGASCPGYLHAAPPVDSQGRPIEGADAAERFMDAVQDLNEEQRGDADAFEQHLARERADFERWWTSKYPDKPVPRR